MDDLYEKTDSLLKSLLSIKTGANKDLMVPAIKAPSLKTPKPSIKQPSANKIPSGLPPPSKKDPIKVAEQLKNPNPGKANVEVLKVEKNGQWSLDKSASVIPTYQFKDAKNVTSFRKDPGFHEYSVHHNGQHIGHAAVHHDGGVGGNVDWDKHPHVLDQLRTHHSSQKRPTNVNVN